jgi:hypothetical protein
MDIDRIVDLNPKTRKILEDNKIDINRLSMMRPKDLIELGISNQVASKIIRNALTLTTIDPTKITKQTSSLPLKNETTAEEEAIMEIQKISRDEWNALSIEYKQKLHRIHRSMVNFPMDNTNKFEEVNINEVAKLDKGIESFDQMEYNIKKKLMDTKESDKAILDKIIEENVHGIEIPPLFIDQPQTSDDKKTDNLTPRQRNRAETRKSIDKMVDDMIGTSGRLI